MSGYEPEGRRRPLYWRTQDRKAQPTGRLQEMDPQTVTYIILGAAGGVALGSYGFLILVPTLGAYGRVWEKLAATFLTLFVLATLVGTGIVAGLVIVYFWDSIIGVFGALDASQCLSFPP